MLGVLLVCDYMCTIAPETALDPIFIFSTFFSRLCFHLFFVHLSLYLRSFLSDTLFARDVSFTRP